MQGEIAPNRYALACGLALAAETDDEMYCTTVNGGVKNGGACRLNGQVPQRTSSATSANYCEKLAAGPISTQCIVS
jgi:hypothetical protein